MIPARLPHVRPSSAFGTYPLSQIVPTRQTGHSRRHARQLGPARVAVSLYDLLGIYDPSSATNAEIRAAYRRLATLYHPDVNSSPVAHVKFQALKLAAAVLTSDLRAQYDKQGLAALPSSEYKLLHDFITRVRAQGSAAVLGEAGTDISTVLGLEFQEAVTGSACTVTTGALGTCPDCKGNGFDASQDVADCPMCHGRGEITVKKWVQAGEPRMNVHELCPACRGSGSSELRQCCRCAGEGRVQVRRHVRIRVPAGVVDGQVLRVKGQGHMGKFGGAPGDLLVKLQVYDLADVARKGDDLYSQLVLSLYEALLGGNVWVSTVRGERSLTVPAGTQHGTLLCARDAGVARPGVNGVVYGHHYFEVSVEIPNSQAACETELQLLEQLAQLVRNQQQPGQQQQQHEDCQQQRDQPSVQQQERVEQERVEQETEQQGQQEEQGQQQGEQQGEQQSQQQRKQQAGAGRQPKQQHVQSIMQQLLQQDKLQQQEQQAQGDEQQQQQQRREQVDHNLQRDQGVRMQQSKRTGCSSQQEQEPNRLHCDPPTDKQQQDEEQQRQMGQQQQRWRQGRMEEEQQAGRPATAASL